YFCSLTSMKHAYKGNVKIGLGWPRACVLILLTFCINISGNVLAQTPLKPIADSLPALKDTTLVPVTDTFDFKVTRDITAPVRYHADDSMILDVPSKRMYLYGKDSRVNYMDNELTAPKIEYDQQQSMVTAMLQKDTAGKVIAYPTFKQADFTSKSDTIRFNPSTQKGITKGTYTQQGEMYIYGEKIKKVSDDVFYALKGRFTTCNLDTPHFAFVSKRIKFINQKMAFTGPVHPEFEGVPLPLMLPFGIYPMSTGRHSGLIAPSFTANEQLGMALEDLGYYRVFSDNWDAVFRGTIYSYGGWTASVSPRYYKRYRYRGDLSFRIQQFKQNFKGDPDFVSNRNMNITWSHTADLKAKPGVTFMANVNAGSSKFNEQVPNSPMRNFQNQMQSTISYSRVWKDKPYNVAIRASHNQNTNQRLINLNIPDVTFNVNTIYPFRRTEPIGKTRWYENLGIALNTNARSITSFYDTAGGIMNQIADNFLWGATHNVPITLSLPPLGPLQVSPNVSYQEKWYQKKLIRSWNAAENKLDTVTQQGFYTAREMSFGLSASTRIFGMYGFRKSSKVQAMRHEIRPSFSVNYKPDMNRRNYYSTQVNASGATGRFYYYDDRIAGVFGEGEFGGISFSIDNNVSMKVRQKGDTSNSELKKVSLIDGLGIAGSYNLVADSFRLSNLIMNFRTSLLSKINITASAIFDPYQYDADGNRIDRLIWRKRPLSLGTMSSANISLQSSFKGGEGVTSNQGNGQRLPMTGMGGMPLTEFEQEALYMSNNPGEFADFSIPWSIDGGYSLTYSRFRNPLGGFTSQITQDVNLNASMNLTPRWKIGMNGYYNITRKEVGTVSMYLSREMHCWQMSVNISPVGRFRFFTINISPKSSMLRDLKVNRTRYFYDF
ncbi:MAG TPA: putative LPS assembly protein LptD, partial [Ferruginibacter sp.]|nr:putative LPS assembly protein LptD [Ferruginibacter sp.]